MDRYKLYKGLKDLGFPQGGAGTWLVSDDDKVYVPRPEEIYTQFIGDPKNWEILTDTLAKAWIQNNGNTTTKKTS